LIAKLQFALTEALDQNEIVYLLVYSYGIEWLNWKHYW
jgi:hypothetical protein